MTIYSGFTHWKWWFSMVMLVYQRVNSRASNHTCMTAWPTTKLGKRSRGPSCEVNLRRFFKSSRISRIKHDKSVFPQLPHLFLVLRCPSCSSFCFLQLLQLPLARLVVGIPVTASVPLAPLAVEGPPLVEMLPSAPARSWGSGKIGDDLTVTLVDLSPSEWKTCFQSSKFWMLCDGEIWWDHVRPLWQCHFPNCMPWGIHLTFPMYRGGELLRSDAEVRAVTAAMPSVLGRRMGQMGGLGVEQDSVLMPLGANSYSIWERPYEYT